MIKLAQMVLRGVNWIHNANIRSYGLERSHLDTQYKKLCHMVLERSDLCMQ